MNTFREALKSAHKEASGVFMRGLANGANQGDAESASDIAFLQSLEASGFKLVEREPAQKMIAALESYAGPIVKDYAGELCVVAWDAAPPLAERLAEQEKE